MKKPKKNLFFSFILCLSTVLFAHESPLELRPLPEVCRHPYVTLSLEEQSDSQIVCRCRANPSLFFHPYKTHQEGPSPYEFLGRCHYYTERDRPECSLNSLSVTLSPFIDLSILLDFSSYTRELVKAQSLQLIAPREEMEILDFSTAPDIQGSWDYLLSITKIGRHNYFKTSEIPVAVSTFFGIIPLKRIIFPNGKIYYGQLPPSSIKFHDSLKYATYPTSLFFHNRYHYVRSNAPKEIAPAWEIYPVVELENDETYLKNIKEGRVPVGVKGHLKYHDESVHVSWILYHNPLRKMTIQKIAALGQFLLNIKDPTTDSYVKDIITNIDVSLAGASNQDTLNYLNRTIDLIFKEVVLSQEKKDEISKQLAEINRLVAENSTDESIENEKKRSIDLATWIASLVGPYSFP